MVDEISPQYKTQLHKKLVSSFSEEEMRTLCFNLGLHYDDLGGRGREANARELIEQCTRSGDISSLVSRCSQLRPKIIWTYQTKLFNGYKRSAMVDNQLTSYLHTYLTARGIMWLRVLHFVHNLKVRHSLL